MESYMDLEVPDTPDRVARRQFDSSSTHRNMKHSDCASAHPQRPSGKSACTSSIAPDETELLFEQARLARLVSENLEDKSSSQSVSVVQKLGRNGDSTESGERMEICDLNHSNPLISSYPKRSRSFRSKKGKEPIMENNKLIGLHKSSELLGLVGSALPTMLAVRPRSRCRVSSSKKEKAVLWDDSYAAIKSSDKGKGILLSSDLHPKSEQALSITLPAGIPVKTKGHKRLVHNGCISPYNIGRNSNGITSTCNGLISEKEKIILPNDIHADIMPRDKGYICCTDSLSNSDQALPSELSSDIPHINTQTKIHCQHGMACSAKGPYSSFSGINAQDNLGGAYLFEESKRTNKQRRLMQSECNSQNNIALSRTSGKQKENEVEIMTLRIAPNQANATSSQIQNVSTDFKEKYNGNRKGKAVAEDFSVADGQNGKLMLKSGRPYTSSLIDVTVSGDNDGNTLAPEHLGWRRTHSQTKVVPRLLSNDVVSNYKIEDASCHQSDPSIKVGLGTSSHFDNNLETSDFPASKNSSGEQLISVMDPESLRKEPTKGKRKRRQMGCSHGESSNSAFDDSKILCLGTSWQPSNLRSSRTRHARHGGVMLGPIIEVDELHSPEGTFRDPQEQSHGVSDSSGAMATQVESDELLARQLQEELYNESPGAGNFEEIDAAVAQYLEQEENARRASSVSRRTQHNRRERLIARLRSQPPSRSTYSSSANRAQQRQSTRIAQLMRDLNFQRMDISMRLNLLEELESEFNNGRGMAVSHILQVQRDFNENDYEMLLALDDNNHRHTGASENQINNLPHSVVQTDNIEEPCAVCLEKPSVGEMIRHLPCLHKFHKDCIDQWLRRKMSCPVCKADVA